MWPLFLMTTLFGVAIGTSYVVVLGNVGGFFDVPDATTYNYFGSPYWLGTRREVIGVLVVFQLLAAGGFLAWMYWLIVHPPSSGILQYSGWQVGSLVAFLLGSVLWPIATFAYLHSRTLGRAIGACAPLWLAAAGIIVAVAGTFECRNAKPYAMVGILLTSLVVVIADGVGWSAMAIYDAIHGRPSL